GGRGRRVDGGGHGARPIANRPAVSSRPRATLSACNAPPDAPLVRLSMAHIAMTVPVRSSKRALTCAAFDPSTDLVAGGLAVTATNGSSGAQASRAGGR